MRRIGTKVVGAGLSIAGAIILTMLLLTPSTNPPVDGMIWDKAVHALAYFVVCLPVLLVWPRLWPVVLGLAALHGAATELIQPMVGRTAEFADFVANMVGAGLAVLVARAFTRRADEKA